MKLFKTAQEIHLLPLVKLWLVVAYILALQMEHNTENLEGVQKKKEMKNMLPRGKHERNEAYLT